MIRESNAFNLAESSRNYPYTYWETESSKSLDHRIQKVLCKKLNADNAYNIVNYECKPMKQNCFDDPFRELWMNLD